MITQKHIDNAKFNKTSVKHVLAPSGMAKMGETTVNGEAVIVFLDEESNELIHHELVAQREANSNDYSIFDQPIAKKGITKQEIAIRLGDLRLEILKTSDLTPEVEESLQEIMKLEAKLHPPVDYRNFADTPEFDPEASR